ncbi:(2Fe-2S)-binding protein [Marinobacteraceae bacterium S3BR75-40.1]
MSLKVNVNGVEHEIEAAADTPLLWVLREELQLTGTKFGCGIGQCGACTVQLDGTPIRSCSTPVSLAAGRTIKTIEGLGTPENLHPLQQAWIDHNVPQCGYCQSGQLMSAEALLRENPSPSAEDVAWYMSGNLCRCGTYPRIQSAILAVAKGESADGEEV